jgi:uncharacterized protein DUF1707
MATGPGHEKALGAAGLGHLRASHADREQIIETLKAAFVQGRLTKDELDARAGQAFAARTYAELAALTIDLPAGLADAVPPRAQAGRPMSNATKTGIWLTIAVAVPAVLSFLGGAQLFLLLTPFYFMALAFLGAEIAVSRHPKRPQHRRPPPGGAPRPGCPPRRARGQAAGPRTTFRPLRFAALPNAASALTSPNLSVTSGARLKLPAATKPIARP